MRKAWATIIAGFVVFCSQGCRSGAGRVGNSLDGKPVYLRLCQYTEARGNIWKGASTNYIGLPRKSPPGTKWTFREYDGDEFVFSQSGDFREIRLAYVEKHNMMSPEAWFQENFSLSPVSLPQFLTEKEKKNVMNCSAEPGMSRAAVMLALGYPPASLSPQRNADTLMYQWKRFDRKNFMFAKDKLVSSQD